MLMSKAVYSPFEVNLSVYYSRPINGDPRVFCNLLCGPPVTVTPVVSRTELSDILSVDGQFMLLYMLLCLVLCFVWEQHLRTVSSNYMFPFAESFVSLKHRHQWVLLGIAHDERNLETQAAGLIQDFIR